MTRLALDYRDNLRLLPLTRSRDTSRPAAFALVPTMWAGLPTPFLESWPWLIPRYAHLQKP